MPTSRTRSALLAVAAAWLACSAAADALDDALRRLGTSRSRITTPRALERDYNLTCRLPLIDDLMASPFRLPSFWEGFADDLGGTSGSARGALELAVATLNDGVVPQDDFTPPPPARDRRSVDAALLALFPELTREALDSAWTNDPGDPDTYELAGRLAALMDHAVRRRAEAFSGARLDELESLGAARLGYFFEGETYDFMTVTPERMAKLVRLADVARTVDLEALAALGGTLAAEAERLEGLALAAASTTPGPILDLRTRSGRLVIGGTADDRWTEPATILVDLGGHDAYGDGLGGALPSPGGVALLVDLGGDDRYESATLPAQGNGTLGVAVLLDAAGRDAYVAKDQAQGSAFLGVGLLVDEGGDDAYAARSLAQGAAAFGLGLLLDRAGSDRFTADGLAQGYGSTLGLGLLHDGAGDDVHDCGAWNDGDRDLRLGNCQGGAVGVRPYPWARDPAHHGGLGLLVDDAGNDRYDAQDHSQGGAYFLGLGALFDRAGDDAYAGRREHHQGGSMHLAAGILMDLGGNDRYFAHDSGQGAGNDRSVGILVDRAGNDAYESDFGNSQAYSRKSSSLSLLLDERGDDAYRCTANSDEERCQAYAQLTSTPHDQSVVLLLDLDGADAYDEPGRADGASWQEQPLVLGLDAAGVAAPRFDAFTRRRAKAADSPLRQFRDVALDAAPREPEAFASWVRAELRAARRAGASARHAPIDQVHLRALRGELTPEGRRAVAAWLRHPSADARARVAKILGRSADASVVPDLLAALRRERDPAARRFVIEALGRLGAAPAHAALSARVTDDPDAACRREALAALQGTGASAAGAPDALLLRALADPSPDMRFTAARSLARRGDPAHAEALAALAQDASPWVRRAAAHALMACGDERGIPLMIGTMGFLSLDNSYYAWGQDIGNLLRQYTNVSFTRLDEKGETRRDDLNAARWTSWWRENEATFRIDPLLPAARLLDEGDALRAAKREDEARERYERALAAVPGYVLATERLRPE